MPAVFSAHPGSVRNFRIGVLPSCAISQPCHTWLRVKGSNRVGRAALFPSWRASLLRGPRQCQPYFRHTRVPSETFGLAYCRAALFRSLVIPGFGLKEAIEWEEPPSFLPGEHRYYAAQGNASRIFGTPGFRQKLSDWRIAELRYFAALSYLASGGLRGPQLYPSALLPAIQRADAILSRVPFLASRMLVVL